LERSIERKHPVDLTGGPLHIFFLFALKKPVGEGYSSENRKFTLIPVIGFDKCD
jgi:hypothetical protein